MWIFFILFVVLWILVTVFLPIKDMIEARLSKVSSNAVEVDVKDGLDEKKDKKKR